MQPSDNSPAWVDTGFICVSNGACRGGKIRVQAQYAERKFGVRSDCRAEAVFVCSKCGNWGDQHWLLYTERYRACKGFRHWGRVPTHLMYRAKTGPEAKKLALHYQLGRLVRRINLGGDEK